MNRLHSVLGGTDLEKHQDLLVAENLHPKQEVKMCEAQLQELKKQPAKCVGCEHSQENARLQEKLAQLQQEAEEAIGRLFELDLEVEQKTNGLAEVELRLKDSLAEKAEEEEQLSRRLRDSRETIASLKAQPQQIKYVSLHAMAQEKGKSEESWKEQILTGYMDLLPWPCQADSCVPRQILDRDPR